MRLRRLSGVAVVLPVALLMAGCSRPAPPITDEQVEAWHALGEEMVPLAAEIEIEASEVTTMGGNSNWVDIVVSFAEFADLRDSDRAVEGLKVAVQERVPRATVATHVIHTGAENFEAEVRSHLLNTVQGLEDAVVSSRVQNYSVMDFPELWMTAYVYVENSEVVEPTWLDSVSDGAQQVASDHGGQIYSIAILPADAVGLDIQGSEIDRELIAVQDFPAFAGSGAESGCVRTDSWAYDVTNDWVIVHPVDEPDGACD